MVDNVGEPVLPIQPVGWGDKIPPHPKGEAEGKQLEHGGLPKPFIVRYNDKYGETRLPDTRSY